MDKKFVIIKVVNYAFQCYSAEIKIDNNKKTEFHTKNTLAGYFCFLFFFALKLFYTPSISFPVWCHVLLKSVIDLIAAGC